MTNGNEKPRGIVRERDHLRERVAVLEAALAELRKAASPLADEVLSVHAENKALQAALREVVDFMKYRCIGTGVSADGARHDLVAKYSSVDGGEKQP